jgi:cadmium resistance protein CadD (predicted permease)
VNELVNRIANHFTEMLSYVPWELILGFMVLLLLLLGLALMFEKATKQTQDLDEKSNN